MDKGEAKSKATKDKTLETERPTDENDLQERLDRTVANYARAFPDVDPLALLCHLELIVTGNAVANGLVRHIAEAGFDLTRPRFTLLRLLYLSPGRQMLQNEIAREMGVTSANVTQIIDALEGEGWVERVVSETDRRFTYAHLTPWGQDACARLVPTIVEFMSTGAEVFSEGEMRQLTGMLQRFRSYLEARYSFEARVAPSER